MSALFSSCKQYRYALKRATDALFSGGRQALFVMLNPSTADETMDDPTIRRCIRFAYDWGCSVLRVGNLYAFRATNPEELWKIQDPVGPENDLFLYRMMSQTKDVLCAWGNNAQPERVEAFIKLAKEAGATLWCLGTTKEGQPRHPLYVKANQKPILWRTFK